MSEPSQSTHSTPTHTCSVRVRFAETDAMGVTYHANYVVWMEVGRTALCAHLGAPYTAIQKAGIHVAVVGLDVRYLAPALYDDEVFIESRVLAVNPRLISFGYRMTKGADGQLLVEGSTKHVFLNQALKPTRLPADFLALFQGVPSP